MSNHVGKDGVIKVNGTAVAEVRSIEITEEAGTVDDTVMGDSWETHQVTQKRWSGAAEVFWDEADAGQAALLVVGASVTFNAYFEGADSGDTYKTGTATVEKLSIKSTHNGMVEASVSLKGNGAVSQTTV